jgi:hypothetical protein
MKIVQLLLFERTEETMGRLLSFTGLILFCLNGPASTVWAGLVLMTFLKA